VRCAKSVRAARLYFIEGLSGALSRAPHRAGALAHGLADIWLTNRIGARARRTETAQPGVSQNAGSTTRCFGAATSGRGRGPVKQAFNLQTNTLWLSDAGRCADVPQPAAERVQLRRPERPKRANAHAT
jgi:hypothetical protein